MSIGLLFGSCQCKYGGSKPPYVPTEEWEKKVAQEVGTGAFWIKWNVEKKFGYSRWKLAEFDNIIPEATNAQVTVRLISQIGIVMFTPPPPFPRGEVSGEFQPYVWPATDAYDHPTVIWNGTDYGPGRPNTSGTMYIELIVKSPGTNSDRWKVKMRADFGFDEQQFALTKDYQIIPFSFPATLPDGTVNRLRFHLFHPDEGPLGQIGVFHSESPDIYPIENTEITIRGIYSGSV